jgi:hypothetical protein
MEMIGLFVLAMALLGVGCLATIVSIRVFPLWIRVRGQEHGRYAGLSASEPAISGGTTRKITASGHGAPEAPERGLSVAS